MKVTFQVKVWNFSLKLIFNHIKLKQLKYKFLKIIIKITPETDSSYSCFIKKNCVMEQNTKYHNSWRRRCENKREKILLFLWKLNFVSSFRVLIFISVSLIRDDYFLFDDWERNSCSLWISVKLFLRIFLLYIFYSIEKDRKKVWQIFENK